MGLKITKSLKNANGTTSAEHYVNVSKRQIPDQNRNSIFITPQFWVSKSEKDAGSKQVYFNIDISEISVSISELETNYYFALVYDKLKTELKSKLGLLDSEIVNL